MEKAELRDIARLARDCAVMTQAVTLSRWITDTGPRPITPRQVLRKSDLPSAAEVIGVSLPTRLRTAADIPALHRPWCLALATGLLRVEDGTVSAGPALACWPPAGAEYHMAVRHALAAGGGKIVYEYDFGAATRALWDAGSVNRLVGAVKVLRDGRSRRTRCAGVPESEIMVECPMMNCWNVSVSFALADGRRRRSPAPSRCRPRR